MMANLPSIVIVSNSNIKPESIIKLITNKADLKLAFDSQGIIKHPWNIDTKYYTAEVNLVGLKNDFIRTDEFNNTIEALIIHMDTNKETGLDDITLWDSFETDCNLDIKLLVCNYCNDDTKINRNKALEWCLKRGFEFVELYPSESTSDEDDDFKEKTGVERIIEALQSHTWSNLVMKTKQTISRGKTLDEKSNPNSVLPESFESDITDNFTELFSQLHVMKDSLQNMPMSQRKQCAEQMVTAFWKALGGEEEELLDL